MKNIELIKELKRYISKNNNKQEKIKQAFFIIISHFSFALCSLYHNKYSSE